MAVRVSPISQGAALIIILIGIFTIAYVNQVAGIAFVILGIALYWLLFRFTRSVRREIEKAGSRKTN